MTEERQQQFKKTYINIATEVSNLSRCNRKKVGSIIVKDGNILGFGFNGTPSGEDNCCEDENNVTKPNVIHAEDNLIRKIKDEGKCMKGSSIFITLAPCIDCAELIIENGITNVYYMEDYRCSKGLNHLIKNNIKVEKVTINDNNICNKT